MRKAVPYNENRILRTTALLLLMGFLLSVIPNISIKLLIFNLSLALISAGVFYLFWKKTKDDSKRYFSLLSYVMLNVLSIYFIIPLLRIYFFTLTFWVGVGMLIIMIILPHLFSRKVAYSIQKPYKSKLGKIYSIYGVLVLLFGGIAYSDALRTSNPDAFVIAIFSFLLAILFLFISPVLLIKPDEMDELMKK